MYLEQMTRFTTIIKKESSEINRRNLCKKVSALAFMPPREIGKLWVMIIDEYQHIRRFL